MVILSWMFALAYFGLAALIPVAARKFGEDEDEVKMAPYIATLFFLTGILLVAPHL